MAMVQGVWEQMSTSYKATFNPAFSIEVMMDAINKMYGFKPKPNMKAPVWRKDLRDLWKMTPRTSVPMGSYASFVNTSGSMNTAIGAFTLPTSYIPPYPYVKDPDKCLKLLPKIPK